jgi:small subunit ribosomal protein S16
MSLAVKIRLLRMGRKKKPFYRIVAVDSRTRRDGSYLEKLGYYNPVTRPATVEIDKEKVLEWLKNGAEPTKTVFNILQREGIAMEWHLIRNKVSEQARHIELQKWELAKKQRDDHKVLEASATPMVEESLETEIAETETEEIVELVTEADSVEALEESEPVEDAALPEESEMIEETETEENQEKDADQEEDKDK